MTWGVLRILVVSVGTALLQVIKNGQKTKSHLLIQGRHNVLLMGDNVGDAEIIDSVDDVETCLKIGFLNDNVSNIL